MNHIKNLKYLKSNDVHFYVGWALLLSGLILFVVGEFLWLYILPFQFLFSIAFIIVGAVVAFLPSALRSSEEDLDGAITQYTDELSKKTLENLQKKLKNEFEPPIVLGRYQLEGENVIIRKGRKDQKYRSSLYSGAIISFKKESLYVHRFTISLISEEKSEKVIDIPYKNLPVAKIEEYYTNIQSPSGGKKKEYLLIISDKEGNEIEIPIINSMIIDQFCQTLNKEVQGK